MEQTSVDSETSYIYQHNNGEFVSVKSFEEALGRCAYLAATSEESPDEAKMWFDLYAQGTEAMKQEEKIETLDESGEETAEENNQNIDDKPGQRPVAEKSGKTNDNTEQTEQKFTKENVASKEAPVERIINQEIITPEPVKKASARESPDSKLAYPQTSEGLPRAREASPTLSPEPDRVGSRREVKAKVAPIAEISQDIVSLFSQASEIQDTPVAKPSRAVQETDVLSLPELADSPTAADARQSEEPEGLIDIAFSPEIEDEAFLNDQAEERISFEDEEFLAPPIEIEAEPLAGEVTELDFEILSEAVLPEAAADWGSNEVLRLKEFDNDEIGAELPLYAVENPVGILEELPTEEVEQTVIELVERIESMDSEEVETVYEILDEIAFQVESIDKLARAEADAPEKNQAEVESIEAIEEELRELFIELFNYAEMEYRPELIEAFLKVVLKLDLSDLVPRAESGEEPRLNPGEGTHEIIQQLISVLTAIKQAAERAYALGKSALILYRQQLAAA